MSDSTSLDSALSRVLDGAEYTEEDALQFIEKAGKVGHQVAPPESEYACPWESFLSSSRISWLCLPYSSPSMSPLSYATSNRAIRDLRNPTRSCDSCTSAKRLHSSTTA